MIKNYLKFILIFLLNTFSRNYFKHKNLILKFLGSNISRDLLINNDVIFILSKPENLAIDKNVTIGKNTLIKIRENGTIHLSENCVIEENCRVIAAREGTLLIKKNTNIGCATHLISGGKITIGENTLVSPFCYISSSKIKIKKNINLLDQDYEHGEIIIGDDVLIGRVSTIVSGTNIENGAIIGANAYVKSIAEENGVYVGAPLKRIGYRN